MSVYNVDNEGVSALNNAANQVSESCEALMKLLGSLTNAAGDNPEGLGPHTTELAAAIEKISAAVENSKAPAEEVGSGLRTLAERYQEIIDDNPFTAFEKSSGAASENFFFNHSQDSGQAASGAESSENSSVSVYNPRSLDKTAQMWTKGAGETLTYDSPIETGKMLDRCQGKVENFDGTCGLCSCENVLRMAGVNVNEADLVKYASTTRGGKSILSLLTGKKLCTTGSSPSSNGGTSAADRKKVLEHFGVPSYTAPQSVQTIADAVSEGRGVIASVYSETLYYGRRPIHHCLHAVTVTSVQKDSGGNILGFYVCDSNSDALGETGATYYTVEEFQNALSPRECNITSTIIR